jgi:hypothetical protein
LRTRLKATLADLAAIERHLRELGVPEQTAQQHIEHVAAWRKAHPRRRAPY